MSPIAVLACKLFGHPDYTYTREVIDGEERTVRTCTRCGCRAAHSGDRTEPFDYWYKIPKHPQPAPEKHDG